MIILSGEKPSFNILGHQAVDLIDQTLAINRQLQVGVFNNATRVISLIG